MKIRLLICVICTALSSLGIIFSISGMFGIIRSTILLLTEEKISSGFNEVVICLFVIVMLPLTWFFYFKICYYWVKFNFVPSEFVVFGTLCGAVCIAATIGFGFIVSLPAVLLMFYIIFFVPKTCSE